MAARRSDLINGRASVGFSIALAGLAACASPARSPSLDRTSGSDGPAEQGQRVVRQDGNADAGRTVFRLETFGNEGFWTDAVRLPGGVAAARVTPRQLMDLGLQIDVDALDPEVRRTLESELSRDAAGVASRFLNDPDATARLFNANAVIGMPARDANHDGTIDVGRGDKVGASCALCHTVTDGSMFRSPKGGSIGHRQDGRANHDLNMGAILATGLNSRALYPTLQLSLRANGGKSLGRAPAGLTENSPEAEVDAYFSNPKFYPVGMFDDSFDGNGDPMHNTPLFRQDLAAPFGSEGAIARLDNFSNLVYTSLFDLTTLTTPGGRAFLHKLGGAAGDEIADNYVKVLSATHVTGYPFVVAAAHPNPGSEDAPVGLRVDDAKLLDLNAYLAHLPAPPGAPTDARTAAAGREVFRSSGCTACHNADQSRPVPAVVVPMSRVFPGDHPVVLAARMPPLNPVENTPESFFDDKMAVVNASQRGDVRGVAMPLLLDLARKPVFLHDNSVATLDQLLDGSRGPAAPHPFYVTNANRRSDVIAYMRGLSAR